MSPERRTITAPPPQEPSCKPILATPKSSWLIEAAWRHCEGLGDDAVVIEGFLQQSFTPVTEWVLTCGWEPDANQRRAGWPAVERAWKKATGRAPNRRASWPAPFEFLECGELVACSITNTAELEAEGEAMGHCIVDYLDVAIAGKFLPFSVRGAGGQRLATFSLARQKRADPWEFQHCVGPLNGAFVHPARDALIEKALELTAGWKA